MMLEDQTYKTKLWKRTLSPNWLRAILFLAFTFSALFILKQSYPRPKIMFGQLWGLKAELLQSIQAKEYSNSKKQIEQWKTTLSHYRISSFFHEFNLETGQAVTSYQLDAYLDDLIYVVNSNDAEKIHPVAAGLFDLHRRFAAQFIEIPPGLNRTEELETEKAEYIIPDSKQAPSLKIEVIKDKKQGWNIQLVTEKFKFTPENVMKEHVEGEGHAQLYVDGKFITRIYGEWYYLGQLVPGNHYIRIVLNTNDDREYKSDDKVIEDAQRIKNENDMEKIMFGTSTSRSIESLRKSELRKGKN